MEIVIGVARKGQRRETRLLHGDADFLVKFANERCFGPLAGLKLTAWKFPESCERFAFRPLRDQHALVGVDQGAGDNESEFDVGHVLPVFRRAEPEERRARKDLLTLLGRQFFRRNKPNLIPSR